MRSDITPQHYASYTNRSRHETPQNMTQYSNIRSNATPQHYSYSQRSRNETPQNFSHNSYTRPLASFRSTPRLFSQAYDPSPRIENSIMTQRSNHVMDRDIEDFEGAIGKLREALQSRRGAHRSPNISKLTISNISAHSSPDRNKENQCVTRSDLEAHYKLLLS